MAAGISTAIVTAMNVAMTLILAQQQKQAGSQDYSPEVLALIDKMNADEEQSWNDLVAGAKARIAAKSSSPK